jgi:hypothetical protein
VKSAHRFDFGRFGEALVERGLIDHEVLTHVLNQCNAQRVLLPEILVRENLVSDWEISRVACELYHLPFLTVESCPPASNALEGYDANYLRHYALVPLDRFGSLVTVVMPGLVPSEVLEGLRTGQSGRVLPVVGSVVSNRRWLHVHLPQQSAAVPGSNVRAPLPDRRSSTVESIDMSPGSDADVGDWGNIFDAGDEAVQLDMRNKHRLG